MSFIETSRIYHIDSHQRTNGTHSDFTIKIDLPPNNDFDRVCLLSATIPKSYYLVQSPYNIFTLSENGTDTVITIPEGNYTALSFRSVLQNLLNSNTSQGWTYSVNYPNTTTTANTGKYTYTVSNNSESKTQPAFIFDEKTKINEQMGFDNETTNEFSSNSLTSQNVIKFIVEDALYLHSDLANNGGDDILQEFFTAGSADFSNIKFETPSVEGYSKEITTNNNNVYKFILSDEDGRNINLNGLNMVFTLLFYKKEKTFDLIKDYIRLKTISQ